MVLSTSDTSNRYRCSRSSRDKTTFAEHRVWLLSPFGDFASFSRGLVHNGFSKNRSITIKAKSHEVQVTPLVVTIRKAKDLPIRFKFQAKLHFQIIGNSLSHAVQNPLVTSENDHVIHVAHIVHGTELLLDEMI